jgi:hypothetical protein
LPKDEVSVGQTIQALHIDTQRALLVQIIPKLSVTCHRFDSETNHTDNTEFTKRRNTSISNWLRVWLPMYRHLAPAAEQHLPFQVEFDACVCTDPYSAIQCSETLTA